MEGHETRLAEFGVADGQHGGVEIDIVDPEIAGFAEAQARDAEQSEQPMVDPRAEPAPGLARCGRRGGAVGSPRSE